MMSLWDALRMNMMISYQELVRTFPNAVGEKADLYVTIKELANQFPAHCHVAIIRSYVHKAKIAEDITDALMKIAATHS
ncbi:hypothetical protein [Klebsiella pneumoniae]|uniref:hypothetical protein n=1 Tax=Klebsiella pneumoniae TaxID=573 RepID=UPI000B62C87C|nr:hypothetical protein [Klebsiella pneumoniae]OVI17533.1 PTS mannose transporter subunit IIA [Klebsiella pneumoniae]SVR19832.1 phosphotransferase system, lactose/cellobiose-specific IIB subunit [Klebsiella pneumoniae]SYA49826.1 phosphotransferase system, lactose/cellobiose-specific IIB subunit [Klebsiella pneumoniae]VAQ18667.1 phosphotransferase system, lactose/cellobiose-specific IIB subunit [Klebsiella pneumoniae]